VACGAVLIGLSGAGRLFTQEVLEALNEGCQHQKPVVMPMSNPTARMECTAEQAQRFTAGRAVFASGSPQDDQEWNGERIASSQANNMCVPLIGTSFFCCAAECCRVGVGV
jgi:malic enzyme